MLPFQPGNKNAAKAHAVREVYTRISSHKCRMNLQLAETEMWFCTLFFSQELFPQNSVFSCRQQMDLAIEICFLLLQHPLYCLLILMKVSTLRNPALIYFIYVWHVYIQQLFFLKCRCCQKAKYFLINRERKEQQHGLCHPTYP